MRAGFLDAKPKRTKLTSSSSEPTAVLGSLSDNLDAVNPEATRSFINDACAKHWRHGYEVVSPTTSDSHSANLLLLLHGRGEASPTPFAKFAKSISLPHTTCVSLLGNRPLPFGLEGKEWFENNDPETGDALPKDGKDSRRIESLQKTVHQLLAFIEALTTESKQGLHFQSHRIHLFGFSDGGTVALEVALRRFGEKRLGGCSVVAASLLPETLTGPNQRSFETHTYAPTPLTLVGGALDPVVPVKSVLETQTVFQNVHPGCVADVFIDEKKTSHSMISSRSETTHLMKFWGMTLGVPKIKSSDLGSDVVEVERGEGGNLRVKSDT